MAGCYKAITDLLEEQVIRTPEAIAVTDGLNKLTYAEVNEKANKVANWLEKQAILPGNFVALFFEPCIEFIVCILGIVKIGAVYLPLDVQAPEQRIEDILTDADAKIVITNKPRINFGSIKAYQLDDLFRLSEKYSKNFSSQNHSADEPIAMLYTSGSTGKPKGVLIPNRAVVNLVKIANCASIQQGDIVAQFVNLAFDPSILEIWGALLNGATLFIISFQARKDYGQLKRVLSKSGIEIIVFPTAYFHQLITTSPGTVDNIKTIVFGGEQVNTKLLAKFLNYRKHHALPIKLINAYGPTEATAVTCYKVMNERMSLDYGQLASIGTAINNVKTYILNESLRPVFSGKVGELYISGANLAIGYHNSTQNKERFIKNPFSKDEPFTMLYKTGDKVKELPSGELLYMGRVDDQVKISGFRIHLHEIESQLIQHPLISSAAVVVEKGGGSHNILTAYVVLSSTEPLLSADEIREFLSKKLPVYMLPAKYLQIEKIPLNAVGKIDKKKLKNTSYVDLFKPYSQNAKNFTEEKLKSIFGGLLNRDVVDVNRNLFELGANSLMITEACMRINKELECELKITDLFTYTSIHKLCLYLEGSLDAPKVESKKDFDSLEIAIVGMACRFPGASSITEYWNNLCEGKECLTRFEKITSDDSNFVPVKGVISDIDKFDAAFFNFDPADASVTDPQQRVFLECAWEALEHSGNIPGKDNKIFSVFAGMADSRYLLENLYKNSWFHSQYNWFNTRIAVSTSTLSTQVSYRFNLNGKSINMNTGCSTGLVALEQACQDLVSKQSDVALVGGISIDTYQRRGYIYQHGGIESSDGYCKPFSDEASGTVFSDGVGVVILKRLADAIRDNDTIYALVRGCGVNNDGARKLGYSAPSVKGQVECINAALNRAQISAENISFIETHGTATALGDVVEFTALDEVYKARTNKVGYCALGSVKSNIGHTDIAAGMAGLIKTVLCLHYQKIPPMLHFNKVNSNIDLEKSPFYINTCLIDWEVGDNKRYAGVSSFGVGGTNAHIILEEYSQAPTQNSFLNNHLILLSARHKKALEQSTAEIAQALDVVPSDDNTSSCLADIAYTLQTARYDFQWRRFAVGGSVSEIKNNLIKSQVISYVPDNKNVVFLFPGQGAQYHKMALQLFDAIPYFASLVTESSNIASSYLKENILSIINNPDDDRLHQTQYSQPALFIIEYALAKTLIYYGVTPGAMIGHSIGEYVAACLAEVFSLEDAIQIICKRGVLMAQAPKGEMLAIECAIDDFYELTQGVKVNLALHNSINNCVASGSSKMIAKLEKQLEGKGVIFQKLKVSHAFHSEQMDEVSEKFKECFVNVSLSGPKVPVISNVTGTWLQNDEAMSAAYWGKHLRFTVGFKEGVETLLNSAYDSFVEVGPGHALSAFVQEVARYEKKQICITHTLPNHRKVTSDDYQLLKALGVLWQHGLKINWSAFYAEEKRRHVALPTYSLQKQSYWVEPDMNLGDLKGAVNNEDRVKSHPSFYIERENLETPINYVPPKSKIEKELTDLWQEVLGISNIGIEDDFFSIGGHSLKALQLLKMINERFKCELSVQELYQAKTISKIVGIIVSKGGE